MLIVMVRIPVGAQEEGEELERRFANRAGMVDHQPGFKGFELLRGEGEYITITRWESREALDNWMHSEANRQAHSRGPARHSAHPVPADGEEVVERHGHATSSVMVYEMIMEAGKP